MISRFRNYICIRLQVNLYLIIIQDIQYKIVESYKVKSFVNTLKNILDYIRKQTLVRDDENKIARDLEKDYFMTKFKKFNSLVIIIIFFRSPLKA